MDSMLKFDQKTIANMTAALDYAYRKIPPGMDNVGLRKKIADAVTATAGQGHRTLSQLNDAGLKVINDIVYPPRRRWFRR